MALIDTLARRVRSSDNPGRSNSGGNSWGWPFPAGIGNWRTDTWRTPSGATAAVTDEGALSLTAFYRGVSLIAGTIGGLPLQVFQEEIDSNGAEGKTTKLKTPDTAHLWHRPNGEMTRQTFWERIVADEVRGNAFIFVVKNARGQVVQKSDVQPGEDWGIWHIARSRVSVGRTTDGVKVYQIDGNRDCVDYSAGGEIIHIPNWGAGIVGYDPVKIASSALRLGLTAEQYASQFLTNGPDALITSDKEITPEQADELMKRWKAQHTGANSGGTAFLGNGATYQQVSVDAEKAQLNALRGFQVAEVARLLGLPTHLLAAENTVSTWGAGMEEQNRMLVAFNFQGHINRIEQAVSDDLLQRDKTNRYAKLNLTALLRGTNLQRAQFYRNMQGIMTPNEMRVLEELEPIEGGDELLAMTNLLPIDQLGQDPSKQPAGAAVL
jgi:HK97 family phage portal protein